MGGLSPDDLRAVLDHAQEHAWDAEPADWYEQRGFTHSTVDRFGLGYTGAWGDLGALGDYSRCIVIPYEDGMGRLRKLRFRPIRPGYSGPKTLDFKGDGPHLFAVRGADNRVVHVAEGEPDTMILWQLGFRAVGMPGAAQFKDHWRFLFRPPHVERVVIALDPDKAGKLAAMRVRNLITEVCEDVRVVRLPAGLDVNDTFLKFGGETLKEAMAA